MGFTALDGLPMGTRPGQLDAGRRALSHEQKGMTAPADRALLIQRLRAEGSVRRQQRCPRSPASATIRARKFALDYFVYRIALHGRILAAAMGGIDGFVFTAGIGENAPAIRAAVVERLWPGLAPTWMQRPT